MSNNFSVENLNFVFSSESKIECYFSRQLVDNLRVRAVTPGVADEGGNVLSGLEMVAR